jgi:hypothetical protein
MYLFIGKYSDHYFKLKWQITSLLACSGKHLVNFFMQYFIKLPVISFILDCNFSHIQNQYYFVLLDNCLIKVNINFGVA